MNIIIILLFVILVSLNYYYPYEEFVSEQQKTELDTEFDKATYLKKIIIEKCK